MKLAIRKIDHALKSLYRLEHALPAEAFLVEVRRQVAAAGNRLGSGALLIMEQPDSSSGPSMEIGIYLDSSVRKELSQFDQWPRAEWTPAQLQAFSVAAEEISHFNYLVENASRHQSVSVLEIEIQGEVDRFVLGFLAERHQRKTPSFDGVFERFFENFHWASDLEDEKKNRYEEAHRVAKSYIAHLRPLFKDHRKWNSAVDALRAFYRLSVSEKIRSSKS